MRTSIDDIFVHNDYRALIREDFLLRTSSNENFSLRAYSKKVGISPTTLSMMFQSKRDLSFDAYKEVLNYFELDEGEQKFAEALYLKDNAKQPSAKEEGRQIFNQLKRKQDLTLCDRSEQEFLGRSLITVLVFNCFDTEYLRKNMYEIPKVLGISVSQFENIVEDLIRHECIEIKENEVNVLKEGLVIGDTDNQDLLDCVLDIKDFSRRKIEEYGKILDKENCISISYHLMYDKETHEEVLRLYKKFQDELHHLCSRKSSKNNYYLMNFDLIKMYDVSDKS